MQAEELKTFHNICDCAFPLRIVYIYTHTHISLSLFLDLQQLNSMLSTTTLHQQYVELNRHNLYEILSPLLGHILPLVLTQLNNRPTNIP